MLSFIARVFLLLAAAFGLGALSGRLSRKKGPVSPEDSPSASGSPSGFGPSQASPAVVEASGARPADGSAIGAAQSDERPDATSRTALEANMVAAEPLVKPVPPPALGDPAGGGVPTQSKRGIGEGTDPVRDDGTGLGSIGSGSEQGSFEPPTTPSAASEDIKPDPARSADVLLRRDEAEEELPEPGGGSAPPDVAPGIQGSATPALLETAASAPDRAHVPGVADQPATIEAASIDRPPFLDAPRGGTPDDLTRITGIGPSMERLLFENGIFHYNQIAAWSDREARWADGLSGFEGRVARENWISEAALLAGGSPTP